ncbi:hypothetical protein ACE1CI_22565 [Aerosakkonemataceae cyanobacterium BLCC-F50]|uniref:Uncharacterized protein n=1 Tax=Floridaenema flaviceps BLCC-F50 TaxID=3153642 RepID=A0ABV4XVZ7_9CYAN
MDNPYNEKTIALATIVKKLLSQNLGKFFLNSVATIIDERKKERTLALELTKMRPLIILAEKLKVDIDFWVSQLV